MVETKGKFTALDRKKQLAFREDHPTVPILMCFMRDNTLSKLSKTRYSEWCEKNSIPHVVGSGSLVRHLKEVMK